MNQDDAINLFLGRWTMLVARRWWRETPHAGKDSRLCVRRYARQTSCETAVPPAVKIAKQPTDLRALVQQEPGPSIEHMHVPSLRFCHTRDYSPKYHNRHDFTYIQ